jgi:hypothetical protein
MSSILADQCNIAMWQGDDFSLVADWVLPVGMPGFDANSNPKASIVRSDKDKTLIAEIAVTIASPTKMRFTIPRAATELITFNVTPDQLPAGDSGWEKFGASELPGKPYRWDCQVMMGGSRVTFVWGYVLVVSQSTVGGVL